MLLFSVKQTKNSNSEQRDNVERNVCCWYAPMSNLLECFLQTEHNVLSFAYWKWLSVRCKYTQWFLTLKAECDYYCFFLLVWRRKGEMEIYPYREHESLWFFYRCGWNLLLVNFRIKKLFKIYSKKTKKEENK